MNILLLVVWLFVSLAALISVDLFSFAQKRAGWRRFAATFFLFYAHVISLEFLLGCIHLLTGTFLAIASILVSATTIYLLHRHYGPGLLKSYLLRLASLPHDIIKIIKSDRWWASLLFLTVGFGAWIVFLGVIFPVTDFDGNSYHMTFVAETIQNHTFFDAQTSLKWLTGYPKGGEFIQLWGVSITNNDMFADIAQIPFLILGVYALYSIAVSFGADKKNARFASLLFFFIPVVLNQLKTTYVDVMLVALFFAGLAFVLEKQRSSKLDYVIIGIIFSLIISVKSTGFLFVAAILPFLVYMMVRDQRLKSLKDYTLRLLLIAGPVLFGLYWYIKNWLLYGSPIFPFGFKLFGATVFPGQTFQEFASGAVNSLSALPHGCVERIWFVWTEQKDWFGCLYNYDTNFAGLGPIWFIILLPSVVVGAVYAFRRKNYLLLALTAVIGVLFAIYPSNYYSRYTMFIVLLGVVFLALILSYQHHTMSAIAKGITLLLACSVIVTNISLCNFPLGAVRTQLISVLQGSVRGSAYANPASPFGLLESKLKSGDTVVYDSAPYFIYPLWRPDFTNTVLYLPATDAEDWYSLLQKNSTDYIVTTLSSKEHPWATASSNVTSIYKDDLYEIFAIH